MKLLKATILGCVGIGAGITLQILVMTQGWGLEARSWWWIIGAGFFGQLAAQAIIRIAASDD